MEAILAATAVAAKNIGYGDRLGTIEVGKQADLISLRADPLTQRWAWNTVHFVMKAGQRYDTLSWN
jgi:imidazolonepropionase-like amidohydrolase